MKKANKETIIEWMGDKSSLNDLRTLSRKTVKAARDRAKNHMSLCFFGNVKITDENRNECHLVPDSFLKIIAVNNQVCTVNSIASLQSKNPENFFDSTLSTKSATTFLGICKACDGPKFAGYEKNPNFEINQDRIWEISLKTLLAFRYFSAFTSFLHQEYIKEICSAAKQTLSDHYSISQILQLLSTNEVVLGLDVTYKAAARKSNSAFLMARHIEKRNEELQIIFDFEIENEPVVAIQSFYVYNEIMMFVNVFPTKSGTRIVVFRNSPSEKVEDETYIKNLSIIEVIAFSMVNFRESVYLSPKKSMVVTEETAIFELLGPRSLKFSSSEDLRGISMRKLANELNLDVTIAFKRLSDF